MKSVFAAILTGPPLVAGFVSHAQRGGMVVGTPPKGPPPLCFGFSSAPNEDKQPETKKQMHLSQELQHFINECDDESATNKLKEELDKAIDDCASFDKGTNDSYALKTFFSRILEHSILEVPEQTLKIKDESESLSGAAGADEGGDTDDKESDPKLTPSEVLKRIRTLVTEVNLESMEILGKYKNGEAETLKRVEDDITAAIKRLNGGNFKFFVFFYTKDAGTIGFDDDELVPKSKVDDVLFKIGAVEKKIPKKEQVERTLKERLSVYQGPDTFPYKKNLVETDQDNDPEFVDDLTKARVWVVAGESGSGKSKYAVNIFPNSYVLRGTITRELGSPPTETSTLKLRKFLELVTTHMFNNGLGGTNIYKVVRYVADYINTERNSWAVEKAEKLLQGDVISMNCDSVKQWYDRSKSGGENITLKELVLVFDECGRSPEFTSGIIARARQFLSDLKGRKLAERLALVLCGSGLEAVKTGTEGNKYIGSDPELTKVITMLRTNLDKVEDTVLRNAIENGTYSRIPASNARMLVDGILPALKNDVVIHYADELFSDRAARLEAFCSFRFAMDYSVRAYMNLNGLVEEKIRRGKLLDKSFRFMLTSSLRSIPKDRLSTVAAAKSQIEAMEAMDAITDVDEEDLFRIGLATRDLSQTSNALRYLACKGMTAPVYTSDGLSFENVVAIHLHRYSECLGITTSLMELRSAWPPPALKPKKSKKDDDLNNMLKKGKQNETVLDTEASEEEHLSKKDIEERVENMTKDGCKDVLNIVEFFNSAAKVAGEKETDQMPVALVLRQGVPSAQGADVMKFEAKNIVEEGKVVRVLELSTYQAKNKSSAQFKSNVEEAAKSLGVDVANKSSKPETGKAGYLYQATLALCKEVAKHMDREARIVNRVIVFSYEDSMRSRSDETSVWDYGVQLWSKEMLEPTISALVVEDPKDED